MIRLALLLSILLVAGAAQAARYSPEAESEGTALNQSQIRLLPGYGYANVQNQDGSKAVFSGPHIGGELDVVFTPPVLSIAIGIFGHYQYSNYKNQKTGGAENQDVTKTEFLYGLKGYVNSLYAGFGYGNTTSTFSNSLGRKMELNGPMIGITAGARLFNLTKNTSLGFAVWYKSVYFSKARNPSLTDSTSKETLEFSVSLTLHDLFVFL